MDGATAPTSKWNEEETSPRKKKKADPGGKKRRAEIKGNLRRQKAFGNVKTDGVAGAPTANAGMETFGRSDVQQQSNRAREASFLVQDSLY